MEDKIKAMTSVKALTSAPTLNIPALSGTVLVAGFDPSDNSLRLLNLGTLYEAQVLAEAKHTLDILDSRNAQKQVKVPANSVVGTLETGSMPIPAGEVWFINRLQLVTPAGVTGNILVSKFPKNADGTDKAYLATDQAVSLDVNYDLPAQGQLGEELRLVGGDTLTVRGIVTVQPVADVNITLTAYGRKGKRLV